MPNTDKASSELDLETASDSDSELVSASDSGCDQFS